MLTYFKHPAHSLQKYAYGKDQQRDELLDKQYCYLCAFKPPTVNTRETSKLQPCEGEFSEICTEWRKDVLYAASNNQHSIYQSKLTKRYW